MTRVGLHSRLRTLLGRTRRGHSESKHNDVKTLIRWLEAEVNNGGFHQFFFNSAGDQTAETIEALEAIGAHKTAAIVRRASAKFPGGMPPAERNARQTNLEVVSPETDAFEQEDQDFYAYEEDLSALVAAHRA